MKLRSISSFLCCICILSVSVLVGLPMAGCADTKIGKAVSGGGYTAVDPSNVGSQLITATDGSSVMNSNGIGERANTDDRFFEQNIGGSAKSRRYTTIELADGRTVTLYESIPGNESLGKMIVSAPGGSFETLTVEGRVTDNAVVMAQVVNLYTANLQAAIKGTDAEFQAVIQKLKSQEAVSKAAVDTVVPMLQAIRTFFAAGA